MVDPDETRRRLLDKDEPGVRLLPPASKRPPEPTPALMLAEWRRRIKRRFGQFR